MGASIRHGLTRLLDKGLGILALTRRQDARYPSVDLPLVPQ